MVSGRSFLHIDLRKGKSSQPGENSILFHGIGNTVAVVLGLWNHLLS